MKRLMDALESVKKENNKLFLGNNIAEIISEICGISETQIFNIKIPALALYIHLPLQLWT